MAAALKTLMPAIRGALLEEIVLHLLNMVGYRTVNAGEEGTRAGHSGLEVRGRGEWHQIDALAAFDYTPAFLYPLRLLVEAKSYARKRPIGIEVARNAVGVLKDISENYFTYSAPSLPGKAKKEKLNYQRYNYHAAIFSTSGFTRGAERYSIAHQVFLVQYKNNRLMQPIAEALQGLGEEHFTANLKRRMHPVQAIRSAFREALAGKGLNNAIFSRWGEFHIASIILEAVREINGSYFGMLQGIWPMHLLSSRPLPSRIFEKADVIKCKVYGRESQTWSFVPESVSRDHEDYFRLDFDLPPEIALLVQEAKGDQRKVAEIKSEHFSFISVSGLIGEVRRQIRLELSEDWINALIERQAANDAKRPTARSAKVS